MLLPAWCLAQSDTTVIYLDAKGKPVTADDDFKSYRLIVKENDHYKNLVVDAFDDKIGTMAYYLDSNCTIADGPWREFLKNGKTERYGIYIANKKEGVWKSWHENGKLADSAFYQNGFIKGLALGWNDQGVINDSMMFSEIADGNGMQKRYWSAGVLESQGNYKAGKKSGEWIFYNSNGNKSLVSQYIADSAVSFTCYDEKGNLQAGDCIDEREANFAGGEKEWTAFLSKKISKANLPTDYFKGLYWGTVWVQFVVEKDGKLTDIKSYKICSS